MAVKITQAITSRAFELIRDQIGAILNEELTEQANLNNEPSLNAEIFVERFVPISDEETPVVNVSFGEGDFGLLTSLSQDGIYTFVIDVYEKSKSLDGSRGDVLATKKLHRLMGVIHGILSHQSYITLGFTRPFIEHTEIKDIKIATPVNTKDASNMIMGRLEFLVRAPETNNVVAPSIIDSYVTQALLGATALGYTYGGDASHLPVEPICAQVPVLINNTLIVNAESGSTVNIAVIDTNGAVVGTWDGINFIVPAGGGACADGEVTTKDSAGTVLHVTTVLSGGIADQIISDSTNTLNGGAISGGLAEGTKAITLKDSLGVDVTPTITTDNKTNFDMVIPVAVVSSSTAQLMKTGATTSYYSNDDGATQRGREVDYFTLSDNNPFGNTDRFTDTLGTQIYANDVVLDWSTYWDNNNVTAYKRTLQPLKRYDLVCTDAPYTHATYSDWMPTNTREYMNVCIMEYLSPINVCQWLNYAPFNIDLTVHPVIWVGQIGKSSNTALTHYSVGLASNVTTTSTREYMITRTYTLAELGL